MAWHIGQRCDQHVYRRSWPGVPLAQYHVVYGPNKRRFKAVSLHRLFETPFRSPQPWLFPLDEAQWVKAWRVPEYAPRRRATGTATQLALFRDDLLNTSVS
jgi:hypothetical protein